MYWKGLEYVTHILNKVNLTEWGIFITNTQSFYWLQENIFIKALYLV